jgi:hypothetical protein
MGVSTARHDGTAAPLFDEERPPDEETPLEDGRLGTEVDP